jgi:PPE-repeat protein
LSIYIIKDGVKVKYLFKLGFLSALMFLLAACGGGESASTTQANTPETPAETTSSTAADETGFEATVTGAVDTELNGSGYFMCDIDELVVGANGRLSNNILILLPRDATAGTTYNMVTDIMSAEQANANYLGDTIENDNYDRDVTGSITLEAVPTQEGERVAGSFEFSATNRADATVTVTGVFDFVAGNDSFFNCAGE